MAKNKKNKIEEVIELEVKEEVKTSCPDCGGEGLKGSMLCGVCLGTGK